jgi:hypothetical protein
MSTKAIKPVQYTGQLYEHIIDRALQPNSERFYEIGLKSGKTFEIERIFVKNHVGDQVWLFCLPCSSPNSKMREGPLEIDRGSIEYILEKTDWDAVLSNGGILNEIEQDFR